MPALPSSGCGSADFSRALDAPVEGTATVRVGITLECDECKSRNYRTSKNRKNTPDRLELRKYCPRCRRHTKHKESR